MLYKQVLELQPYYGIPTKLDVWMFLVNALFCFLTECS